MNMKSESSDLGTERARAESLPRKGGRGWFGLGGLSFLQNSLDDFKAELVELLRREVVAPVTQLRADLVPNKQGVGPAADAAARALVASEAANARGRAFADRLAFAVDDGSSKGAPTPNRLETFFDAHTSGPGLWKWRHYFDIYHRHFSKFVDRKPTILEIGVFSGGSLAMWQEYFGAGCKIFGVDMIDECRRFESDSVHILIGDQGDRDFWRRFKAEVPPIDIVIDDGSHLPEHQMVTMEEMLPHLRPGGVYLCEDIYNPEFDHFVDGFSSRLNALGPPVPGEVDHHKGMTVSAAQKFIQSIHRYPLVTVLERTRTPVEMLTAPQRGTDWLWAHWK